MRFPVRHLFLDLEDTIITPVISGWWNTECINVRKVKEVIERWKPDFVHLFSFAVHNHAELDKFKLGTLTMIEERFGFTLNWMWTVDDDIIPMCCNVTGLHPDTVTFEEMSAFWGKGGAFRLCMQHTFAKTSTAQDVEVMLLDDVVQNETFKWPDHRVRGHLVNIVTPPQDFIL